MIKMQWKHLKRVVNTQKSSKVTETRATVQSDVKHPVITNATYGGRNIDQIQGTFEFSHKAKLFFSSSLRN